MSVKRNSSWCVRTSGYSSRKRSAAHGACRCRHGWWIINTSAVKVWILLPTNQPWRNERKSSTWLSKGDALGGGPPKPYLSPTPPNPLQNIQTHPSSLVTSTRTPSLEPPHLSPGTALTSSFATTNPASATPTPSRHKWPRWIVTSCSSTMYLLVKLFCTMASWKVLETCFLRSKLRRARPVFATMMSPSRQALRPTSLTSSASMKSTSKPLRKWQVKRKEQSWSWTRGLDPLQLWCRSPQWAAWSMPRFCGLWSGHWKVSCLSNHTCVSLTRWALMVARQWSCEGSTLWSWFRGFFSGCTVPCYLQASNWNLKGSLCGVDLLWSCTVAIWCHATWRPPRVKSWNSELCTAQR